MHLTPSLSEPDPPPARTGRWRRVGRTVTPTLRFWMETEVHVAAFSVAANVLLSFFPFLIVMLSLCRYVFKWHAANDAIYLALNYYFPDQLGSFIKRNLIATVESRGPFQIASVLLLMFTANGVFEPMEVALNRVFGIAKNRSFFKNQLVSLVLIFACGGLGLLSTTLTALNQQYLKHIPGLSPQVIDNYGILVFRLCSVPLVILTLFLIYWLLPNARIPPLSVVPTAIIVGLMLEALRWVDILTWPWLRVKLAGEYGPFVYSVTIILWSFCAALLVLGGADWAARHLPEDIRVQKK